MSVHNLPSARLFALGIIGESVGKCAEPGCVGTQNVCFLHGEWATCWCDTCGAEVRVPVRRPKDAKDARKMQRLANERCAVTDRDREVWNEEGMGGAQWLG